LCFPEGDLEALVVRPCSEPRLQLGVRRFVVLFVLGLPAVRRFNRTIIAQGEPPSSRRTSDRRIDPRISQESRNSCVAVDGAGRATTYDGRWSKPVTVARGAFAAVSCPSRTFCIAVGSAKGSNNESGPLVAVDSHGTWSSSTGPIARPFEALTGVSCVSAHFCVVSGTYWGNGGRGTTAFVQTFDGHSWTVVFNQNLTGYASGDSMADVGGLVDVDTDGTWAWAQISDDRTVRYEESGGLGAIACSAVNSCVAAGPSGYVYSNHGRGWTVELGDPQSVVTDVSCPDAQTCLAVDSARNVLVSDRGDREVARSVDPGHALSSLSCPTTGFCVAIDTAGRVVMGRP